MAKKYYTWDELVNHAKSKGANEGQIKAIRKEQKKAQTSAKKAISTDAYGELNDWNNDNQRIMEQYNNYAYALSQDYLDAEERYISMASDAQKEANDFNAEQAQIQRDWSESMSASAHQREVADLKAAGLNPVISAYGSGASVGSGAAASSSNNLTSAFGQLASQAVGAVAALANSMQTSATSYANAGLSYSTSIRSADVQQYAAELASKTNLDMNKATNEMNKYIAELNQMNQKDIARIAADANISSAQVHAAANNYGAEIAYASAVKTAQMNNQTSKEIAEMQVNKSFEGIASSALRKAGNLISDMLSGTGAYGVHNYNQSIGQE